jgi:tetratricopeptide (TPR) repeat protein
MIHKNQGEYKSALEYYKKSLKIAEKIGDRSGIAITLHQIGNIHYREGEYKSALEYYQKSLKIAEEIGDRSGIASSHGQIGKIFCETNKFKESFECLFNALIIFVELESPYAKIVLNFLTTLRQKWGTKEFDSAYKNKTGKDVPDVFKA